MADWASVKRPPGPDVPAACRSLSAMCSTWCGLPPTASAPNSSTATFSAPVIAAPKKVTPTPSIPSVVRILATTMSRVAPGTVLPSARGSSAGKRTIWDATRSIFMATLPGACAKVWRNHRKVSHASPVRPACRSLSRDPDHTGPDSLAQLSGPTLWPNSLAQLSGPTLWPNSLAQLSGPALWPSSLAQLLGPALWPSPLAQPSGPALWPSPLAQASGPNLWPKPLAKTSGQNLWIADRSALQAQWRAASVAPSPGVARETRSGGVFVGNSLAEVRSVAGGWGP